MICRISFHNEGIGFALIWPVWVRERLFFFFFFWPSAVCYSSFSAWYSCSVWYRKVFGWQVGWLSQPLGLPSWIL